MYRHLLVPTDGSDISTENVARAVQFAREAGARITFFHASPDYGASGDGALMRAVSPELFAERAKGHARMIVLKAEEVAKTAGVSCRAVIRTSDRPAEAILEAAAAEGCDLIFMASRGPKSIAGVMVGSETLKVLCRAPLPVLVSEVAKNVGSST
jgi:nucleotide-binding universal stress UspA family protein